MLMVCRAACFLLGEGQASASSIWQGSNLLAGICCTCEETYPVLYSLPFLRQCLGCHPVQGPSCFPVLARNLQLFQCYRWYWFLRVKVTDLQFRLLWKEVGDNLLQQDMWVKTVAVVPPFSLLLCMVYPMGRFLLQQPALSSNLPCYF